MGRYSRRAEFLGKVWGRGRGERKEKKWRNLTNRVTKGEKLGRIRIRSRILPSSSLLLVSPRVNIESKYTPAGGYLGKMKRGEFERND